jgi:hypothetical protein
MECYACADQATRQCRRCARVYCEMHGADLCAECLSPASALPSFNLYRGSLLALLVGSALAIWLLVRPTGDGSGPEIALADITPTAVVTEVANTSTPGSATVVRTSTPRRASTATPAATATPGTRPYIVQDGDTLLSIAERFAPPGIEPMEYARRIAFASGLSSTEEPIAPGQTLVLPD